MPSIIEHLRGLQEPDPLQQGIRIPAQNFVRYGSRFDGVFGGAPDRYVTRADVFAAFQQGVDIGSRTAIAWGFPRGGRPGGRPLTPAIDAIPHFEVTLAAIQQGALDTQAFDTMNALDHVKNGVTTKILYFASAKTVTGAEALIYDSRVQTHLLARDWDEYRPLVQTLRSYILEPSAEQYLQFLETTGMVARESGWKPAAIEMLMFGDAPGRRPPGHR